MDHHSVVKIIHPFMEWGTGSDRDIYASFSAHWTDRLERDLVGREGLGYKKEGGREGGGRGRS